MQNEVEGAMAEEADDIPKCFASPEMQMLRARSLAEWMSRINRILEGDVRGKVMSIVWWDFLSGGMAGSDAAIISVRPKFGSGEGAEEKRVIMELKRLDYPDKLAEKRGREPKTYDYEKPEAKGM